MDRDLGDGAYRNDRHPHYVLEEVPEKTFPAWRVYYLSNETKEMTWRLVATNLENAFIEADAVIEEHEN